MNWLKKLFRVEIDERQQADLNRITSYGYWIAFYLLVAALLVEGIILERPFREWAVEWFVFMIIAIYEVIACIRIGVWSPKKQNPGKKDYVRYSVIASVLFSVVFTVGNVMKMSVEKRTFGSIAAVFAYWFILLFVVMIIGYSVSGAIFHRRRKKIEEELDEECLEDEDE